MINSCSLNNAPYIYVTNSQFPSFLSSFSLNRFESRNGVRLGTKELKKESRSLWAFLRGKIFQIKKLLTVSLRE